MKETLLFLFFFLIYSCQPLETNWGIAKDYFPSADLLSNGIVNKYYIHNQEIGKEQISTHVIYESSQLIDKQLHIKRYRTDFSLQFEKVHEFENDQMLLMEERRFLNKDTAKVTIKKADNMNWRGVGKDSEKTIHFEMVSVNVKQKQVESRDTILLGLPTKTFHYKGKTTRFNDTDTIEYIYTSKLTYVQGLGLYAHEYKDSNTKEWRELIEQIPLNDFKLMAGKERNRVAYIDPNKTLDKNDSFQSCNSINRIYDYYNGQKITYYEGGKKKIWSIVHSLLDKEKLFDESGYLTFRFVVNCKGEVGRVITEQAGLDFQRKQFDTQTVSHFHEILQNLKSWIPIKNRNKETVDAYYYLTFKLKNGILIELLP